MRAYNRVRADYRKAKELRNELKRLGLSEVKLEDIFRRLPVSQQIEIHNSIIEPFLYDNSEHETPQANCQKAEERVLLGDNKDQKLWFDERLFLFLGEFFDKIGGNIERIVRKIDGKIESFNKKMAIRSAKVSSEMDGKEETDEEIARGLILGRPLSLLSYKLSVEHLEKLVECCKGLGSEVLSKIALEHSTGVIRKSVLERIEMLGLDGASEQLKMVLNLSKMFFWFGMVGTASATASIMTIGNSSIFFVAVSLLALGGGILGKKWAQEELDYIRERQENKNNQEPKAR